MAALAIACAPTAAASAVDYPEIRALSRDDLLFVQIEKEVECFYQSAMKKESVRLPPLSIFTYKKRPTEDLFSINARLGLPYDSIATLNGMESVRETEKLDKILIPSLPGIFVPDPPRTELQSMVLETRRQGDSIPERLVLWKGDRKIQMLFFPGSLFNDVERAYFLCVLFRFPITQGSITSRYGPRTDPFSGEPEFHNGIDIGAPEGTDVHAAREGSVTERGTSASLGNYLILSHPGGYQTVYGHLSAFSVTLGQEVSAGEAIGTVGHTGLATGPHLHFEIRSKGRITDPSPFLRVSR
jgi:murein DD-endopeptidase MepM/ murein hydrolase activator NlpD